MRVIVEEHDRDRSQPFLSERDPGHTTQLFVEKEISVKYAEGNRRLSGASVLTIVVLYLWRFLRPVLIANLLAWPFAIYFVLQWIERFPYQLDKAWLLPLCLGAALVVLLISLFTVSIITVRAAAANPVQSLRYE